MEIKIKQVRPAMRRFKPADDSKLGFGVQFSNHMFLLDYNLEEEWHDPRIVPYGPLSFEPAAVVFHYAQEVFEGLKAYRGEGGEIYLFRAKDNLRRMQRSADRLCIPAYPEDLVYEGLKKLIEIDQDWVPSKDGATLYVRPTIIASENFLGVRPANEYLLFIITGPVGAYYPEGFAPVKILVEDEYVRAAVGGVGEAKTSGNYAAGLKAQEEAHKKGFSQVMWLDGVHRKFVEEVGTMNIMFKFRDELATAPLGGTILPGVTRDSILTLARDMGLTVNERPIEIDEVLGAAKSGELVEVFGTGTAAVVSPVSLLNYKGQDYQIGDGQAGPLATELFNKLSDIQFGRADDPHGWRERIV